MFFEAPSGRFIRDPERRRLPEYVWALYREEVTPDPRPVHCESFIQWKGFSIAAFALEDSQHITIEGTGFDVRRPYFKAGQQPEVRGATSKENGFPVFSGIPEIEWEGEANLALVKDASPQGNIDLTQDEFRLMVDEPGEYQVELRGPLGQNYSQNFLLIPGCSVSSNPEISLPDSKPIVWNVSVPEAVVTRRTEEEAAVRGESNSAVFDVFVAEKDLQIKVTVPRLEWSLNVDDSKWSTSPILINLKELISGEVPVLSCRLGLEADGLEMTLVGKKSGHRFLANDISVQGERFWHFNLSEIRDQLLETGQTERFDLVVTTIDRKTLFRDHIIEVRPEWDLQDLWAHPKLLEDRFEIKILWSEQEGMISGRWLAIQPIWRPWEAPALLIEVPGSNRGHYLWEVPRQELRPGRYQICAIHAPWGVGDDLVSYERHGVCYLNIYPEIWPETFSQRNSLESVEVYLETVLAHWHRPERVDIPLVPVGLAKPEIIKFLKLLGKAGDFGADLLARNPGPMRIFCANPGATSSALAEIGSLPGVPSRLLPPMEVVNTKIGRPDIEFLVDLVLNWDSLRSTKIAASVARGHRPKDLCIPLQSWRKDLLPPKNRQPKIPDLGNLIFLCGKFDVLQKRSAAARSEFQALKDQFLRKEA